LINGLLNALKKAEKKFKVGMSEVEKFEVIQKQFVGQINPAFQTPIFSWMAFTKNRLLIDKYKPKHRGIYKNTKIKDVGWVGVLGITGTIKVNSVLIGIDKLGHFICQGLQYYREYMKKLAAGASENDANMAAIKFGHILEMESQGLKVDGVYSVGDLAANWQGFKFWKNMFKGDNPYFQLRDGRHFLAKKFTLENYVTHDFDEALNPSFFDKVSTYNKVTKNIKDYCKRTKLRFSANELSHNWILDTYIVNDFPNELLKPDFNCRSLP